MQDESIFMTMQLLKAVSQFETHTITFNLLGEGKVQEEVRLIVENISSPKLSYKY